MLIFTNHQNIFNLTTLYKYYTKTLHQNKLIYFTKNSNFYLPNIFWVEQILSLLIIIYKIILILNKASMKEKPNMAQNCQKTPRIRKQYQKSIPHLNLNPNQKKQFSQEDIVWGKIIGFPWWPAVVAQKTYPIYRYDQVSGLLVPKSTLYRIEFLGQPSHAFLDEAKIECYLPNRDYFIDLASKYNKKIDWMKFQYSVKQADRLSQSPFEVQQHQEVFLTPKKNKMVIEDFDTGVKLPQKHEQLEEQNQNHQIKLDTQDINKLVCKDTCHHIQLTDLQKKLARYLLKLLTNKNKNKYSSLTLKMVIIKAIETEKGLRTLRKAQFGKLFTWIKKIQYLSIQQILQKYDIKDSQTDSSIKTPKKKQQQTFYYIDENGQPAWKAQHLEEYDFQIVL